MASRQEASKALIWGCPQARLRTPLDRLESSRPAVVPRRGAASLSAGLCVPRACLLGLPGAGAMGSCRPQHLMTAGHPARPPLQHPNPQILLQVNQSRPDREQGPHALCVSVTVLPRPLPRGRSLGNRWLGHAVLGAVTGLPSSDPASGWVTPPSAGSLSRGYLGSGL